MADNVNHPAHYTCGFKFKKPECIDFTKHMSFCRGNAFKYVWRCGLKGDKDKWIEDLKKAKWYLESPHSHCGTTNLDMVTTLFNLLKQEKTHKFNALRSIAEGWYGLAIIEINKMIKEIEVSK